MGFGGVDSQQKFAELKAATGPWTLTDPPAPETDPAHPGSVFAGAHAEGDVAINTGLIGHAQLAHEYVYYAPGTDPKRLNPDGSVDPLVADQAGVLDRNIRRIRAVSPELADNPSALLTLANDPSLDERLRAIAKGRDLQTIGAQATAMQTMPLAHQTAWWANLPDQQKAAFQTAGYVPPEQLQIQQFPGYLAPGNIDLHHVPVYNDNNTVHPGETIVFTEHGTSVVIPAAKGGHRLTDQEAIDEFHRTGKNLGTFQNEATAANWANALGHQQALDLPRNAKASVQESGLLGNLDDLVGGAASAVSHGVGALSDVGNNSDFKGLNPLYDIKQGAADVTHLLGLPLRGVQTAWRVADTAAGNIDAGKPLTYGSDNWWSMASDAWNGSTFIRPQNVDKARDLVQGDPAALDLLKRVASGDSLEKIVGQYGDPGSPEYSAAWVQVNQFLADPVEQQALEVLQRGHISFGRSLAEAANTVSGGHFGGPGTTAYNLLSGGGDLGFDLGLDPLAHASKISELTGLGSKGITEMEALDHSDQVNALHTAGGTTLNGALGRSAETGVDVTNQAKYWRDLATAPISAPQREAVAMADHVDNLLHGGNALATLSSGKWANNPVLGDIVEYARKVTPTDNLGNYIAHFTPDDAVDFLNDQTGVQALIEGRYTTTGVTRVRMPELSRLGSARVLAKVELAKSMNWLDENLMTLKHGGLNPLDVITPNETLINMQANLLDSGQLAADDALITFKDHLQAAGYDPETVTREVNRAAVYKTGLVVHGTEKPMQTLLRGIVSAEDPGQADGIRRVWAQAMTASTGITHDTALASLAPVEDAYRQALGITDEAGIFSRANTLSDAVTQAAGAGSARGQAAAKAGYLDSLQRAQADPTAIESAAGSFDGLVDRYKALHGQDPVDALSADLDLGSWFKRTIAYPLASTVTALPRLIEKLATTVPEEYHIAFDSPDSAIRLRQLMSSFGVRGTRADDFFSGWFMATDAGKRAILRDIYATGFRRIGAFDDPAMADVITHWMSTTEQHYSVTGDAIEATSGRIHNAAIYPDSHVADAAALPHFREILATQRRTRFMRGLNGYGNRLLGVNSDAADGFMNYWKAAQTARPATGIRAGGEEAFLDMARRGFGATTRNQVLARAVAPDPMIVARMRGAALRETADAIETGLTRGLPEGFGPTIPDLMTEAGAPEGFDTPAHAFAAALKGRVSRFVEGWAEPEQIHAIRMLSTDPVMQDAELQVSGLKKGFVPDSRLGHDPGRDAFSFMLSPEGDAGAEWLGLRGTGKFGRFGRDDDLFVPRWSHGLLQATADRAGRVAAASLSLRVDPEAAARIADVAGARTSMIPGETGTATVNTLRDALGSIHPESRSRLINWVDHGRATPFPDTILKPEDVTTIGRTIGNPDVTHGQVGDLLNELSNADRQTLLATAPHVGGLHVGWWQDLTRPDTLYKGSTIGEPSLDAMLTDGWPAVAPHADPFSYAGPGMYLSGNGPYAESYAHFGDITHEAATNSFRWKQGAAPKLMDGASDLHVPEMQQRMRNVTADVVRHALPGRPGELLAHAYSEGMTSTAMGQLVDDLGQGLTPTQRQGLLGAIAQSNTRVPLPATNLADAIRSERQNLVHLLHAATDHGLGATDGAIDTAFNDAYGRHVVDHFTKQGYRGITDSGTDTTRAAIALWDPSLLDHTGVVPHTQTIAHQIMLRDTADKAAQVRLVQTQEGPAAEQAIRQMAADRVEQKLLGMNVDHMDRMSADFGVVQPDLAGRTRLNVPMVPQRTLRALADAVARTGPVSEATAAGAVTGTTGALDTASLLGASGNRVPPHLEDLLDRLANADPTHPFLPARIGTTDPVLARTIAGHLQDELAHYLGDGFETGVHLGHIDLRPEDYTHLPDPLAHTQAAGDIATQAASAAGTDGAEGQALLNDPALKPVAGGSPLRWVDNDLMLSQGVSFHSDDPTLIIPDLTNEERGVMQQAVMRLRAANPDQATIPILSADRIRSDKDLAFALRQEITRAYGSDPAQVQTLLDELNLPAAHRDPAALVTALGPEKAAVAQELLALPKTALPYLFEGVGAKAEGVTLGQTRYALADGISYQDARRQLAEKIVDHTASLLTDAEGRPIQEVSRAVGDGTYAYRTHLAGQDGVSMPAAIIGPHVAPIEEPGRFAQFLNNRHDRIARIITAMSRHPMWMANYVDAIKDAEPILRSRMLAPDIADAAGRLLTDPQAAGDKLAEMRSFLGQQMSDSQALETLVEGGFYKPADPLVTYGQDAAGNILRNSRTDFTDDEQSLLHWWASETQIKDEAQMAASLRATRATTPYIHNNQVRSQFSEMLHNVIPFWYAQENFVKRWARVLVHSPLAMHRMQLMHNALRATGTLRTNAQGQEVFDYPLVPEATRAIAHAVNVLLPGADLPLAPAIQGQLNNVAPGFEDTAGLPTVGPLGAIPLQALRSVFPQIGLPLETALVGPAGQSSDPNESFLHGLMRATMPAVVTRSISALTGSDLGTSVVAAIQALDATHPELFHHTDGSDLTAEETDAFIGKVRDYARFMIGVKAVLGLVTPATPLVNYDPHEFSAEFVKSLTAGVPIEEALHEFLTKHPNANAYTIFATDSPSRAPTDETDRTYQAILDNQDFYNRYHYGAAWLLPKSAPTDPYQRNAFYELLASKMRERKDPLKFYNELKIAEAAPDYYASEADVRKALDGAKNNARARAAINKTWADWKATYFAGHRIFAEDLQTGVRHQLRTNVIDETEQALNDPQAPAVDQSEFLRNLIASYRDFITAKGALGQTTRDRNLRKSMIQNMVDWGNRYSAGNIVATMFWRRILLPEVAPGQGYAADQTATPTATTVDSVDTSQIPAAPAPAQVG